MGAKPNKVRFSELANFTPKQKEAFRSMKAFKFLLYGGAMGGGKSRFLRWALLYLLMHYYRKYGVRGVRVGLFCEDYPALKDRQISKIDIEFPPWLGTMNKADHEFVLKPEYGGGVLCFRNLDDPSKYQSSEFAAVAVDEITKNIYEVFTFLRSRMRWPGIEDVKFLAATNPGGIGHVWVKKLWIDHVFEPGEQEQEQFVYVHARAADNPHLASSYLTTLAGLPEAMKKAFVDGDWNIFKGQYFGEWRNELHTCAPFAIPNFWRRFVCGDYGYSKPAAVYWCAMSPDGKIYVYRELYGTGYTYEKLMEEVVALTPTNERIEYMVFDPAIWAKKDNPVSGADIFEKTYKRLTKQSLRLLRGMNERVAGWNVLREYLKPFPAEGGEVDANMQVFTTCTELIRTMPGLVYDKHRVEDVDSDGEDHGPDAIRYGVMSAPRPTEKPKSGIDAMLSRSENQVVRMRPGRGASPRTARPSYT